MSRAKVNFRQLRDHIKVQTTVSVVFCFCIYTCTHSYIVMGVFVNKCVWGQPTGLVCEVLDLQVCLDLELLRAC